LGLAAASFREQMQYLKTNGYRVVSLADFVEFTRLGRQLPQRAVVLTFDDGYRSFKDYAYPVLKELGFTATLFIYTDWVGAGRGSLSWNDLRELTAAGFDIEAHTKTHADLRRAQGETEALYSRRMRAELELPQDLFNKNLGRRRARLGSGGWRAVTGRSDDAKATEAASIGRDPLPARHRQQAELLERDAQLRRAAEESKIVLTITPTDAGARESLRTLQARIDQVV